MLNQVVLVGRINKISPIKTNPEGLKFAILKLIVSRTEKNKEGYYDNDCIKIFINESMANSINEHCKKEDVIGIKGKIQVINNYTSIIAEKITFLSSREEG